MMQLGRLESTAPPRATSTRLSCSKNFTRAHILKHESIFISYVIVVVKFHNFMLHTQHGMILIFHFAATAKRIGEAQDTIDSTSRSTVGGKRSEIYAKHMYV